MAKMETKEIAVAMLAIAVANRRLWPPQTKWAHGGERPLDATARQTLFLLWIENGKIDRDEIARRLHVEKSAVQHAFGKLSRRGLVEDVGRHPIDHRRRYQWVTVGGNEIIAETLALARPLVEEIARERRESDLLWP